MAAAEVQDRIARELQIPDTIMLVAERDGQVAGFCEIRLADRELLRADLVKFYSDSDEMTGQFVLAAARICQHRGIKALVIDERIDQFMPESGRKIHHMQMTFDLEEWLDPLEGSSGEAG